MFKLLGFIFFSLVSVVGFMFMPWYIFLETDGGGALALLTDDFVDAGKYTLLLIPLVFIATIVISMWKRDESTRPWSWYFVMSLLNAVPAIWGYFYVSNHSLTVGIGIWLVGISSVAMILISLMAIIEHRRAETNAVVADQKSY